MSWHFLNDNSENSRCLQEQAEASWEGYSLDGAPSALLKLMPTAEECCSRGNETESLSHSRSGMTCEPSMAINGEERSMSSQEDSLAKTLAAQAKEPESTESEADYGKSLPASLAKYDPDTSSWRTHQCSLFGGLEEFSETWPRWGMMRDGECWGLTMSERLISESGSGFWPTITARDYRNSSSRERNNKEGLDLIGFLCRITGERAIRLLPSFAEAFQGFPTGWTGLEPLEMDKFRTAWLLHGRSFVEAIGHE